MRVFFGLISFNSNNLDFEITLNLQTISLCVYNNAGFVCSVYQNEVRNVSCKDSVLAIQNEKVIVL